MKTDVTAKNRKPLTRKDFASDQAVRWCPGCGDFMILAIMQKAFAQMDHPKEKFLSVSGIGCSSRITYYLDTYGIHSIHGRAIAVATGAKLAKPDLNVWVFTGDGDCMAIGGNHFIHACRRNADLNIVIFNNNIYGMTKGQSSPTTPVGKKTKTSPEGSYENPFNIGEVAIGAGVSFFARVPDNDPLLMEKMMLEAYHHKGTSVIEVLQNCVIFTDGIHEQITGKETKQDNQIVLEEGKPMIFGKENERGLTTSEMRIKTILPGPDAGEAMIHNPADDNIPLQMALVKMQIPELPVATGVIRKVDSESYSAYVHKMIAREQQRSEFKTTSDLYHSGNTWEIE
ncbi:MAG: 2-oxoacid:ferredoxin oxidoreductase subunit beta [Balneolaceae bacterium]|nr:MAG: 2-oxoacid:ferredoxin oxidoreductase subunit beta [Balneolaceae bacterium]